MKVLLNSYFPLLRSHRAGGAQMFVHGVVLGLARHGIHVTVVCPEHPIDDFLVHDLVEVRPILKEATSRPLTIYEQMQNRCRLAEAADDVDIIWTIDRDFPVPARVPVVLTLQTICYELELAGLLNFNWDALTVPSQYLFRIIQSALTDTPWEALLETISLIPNGIDIGRFCRSESTSLKKRLSIPDDAHCLVFPHRPDAGKGLLVALAVMRELADRSDCKYVLTVPARPLSIAQDRSRDLEYYRRLAKIVDRMDLQESVIFHNWLNVEDLPAYFTMADYSLALGTLPEGFGFTVVEAISCGTPVIATRAGAIRELLPPSHGVLLVDFDAVHEITRLILGGSGRAEVHRGAQYVETYYSLEHTVDQLVACFAGARKRVRTAVEGQHRPGSLQVSPWIQQLGDGTYWHDLMMKRIRLTQAEQQALAEIMRLGIPIAENELGPAARKLRHRGVLSAAVTEPHRMLPRQ